MALQIDGIAASPRIGVLRRNHIVGDTIGRHPDPET
jgi:hypothetical protein